MKHVIQNLLTQEQPILTIIRLFNEYERCPYAVHHRIASHGLTGDMMCSLRGQEWIDVNVKSSAFTLHVLPLFTQVIEAFIKIHLKKSHRLIPFTSLQQLTTGEIPSDLVVHMIIFNTLHLNFQLNTFRTLTLTIHF